MKRAFVPVRRMVAVTKRITAEDLSLRLESVESQDEIGELADTLNSMIARLERSFQQIRQFSGDVSHELKTPLTELKCNAEVVLRKQRTSKEYQTALQNVIEDADHLQKIIEDLLLLARMDSHSQPFTFTRLALYEVFFQVFEHLHPLAQQKGLALEFQKMENVFINGDSSLLNHVFTNLITNAIQYTPSGGKVTFALHQQASQAILTITDTGIGIPEQALPNIFDRFYRVEQSRSHETGGSGLGLAIAQHIVDAHGGTIEVKSTIGKGTTFQVVLPCQR
jgi:heavy metal sensor kinase